MGEDLDPYYRWLGIPPEEQPPDHYRLLGIRALEADAEIIRTAAEQRTAYLRTFQLSRQGQLAERLLNEVSAARACLLSPALKAEYDQRFREETASAEGAEKADGAGHPPPLPKRSSVVPPPVPPPVSRRALRKRVPHWLLPAVAVAALCGGVLLGVAVLRWPRGGGEDGPVARKDVEPEPPKNEPAALPPPIAAPQTVADLPEPAEKGPAGDAPPEPDTKPEQTQPAEVPGKPEKPDASTDKPEVPGEKSKPAPILPVKEKPAEQGSPKPDPRKPQPDPRIEQFRAIFQAVRPLFEEWARLEKEAAPLRAQLGPVVALCTRLEQQTAQLQRHLVVLNEAYRAARSDPNATETANNLSIEMNDCRQRLLGFSAALGRARGERAGLESQIRELTRKQTQLIDTADGHSRPWIPLCDLFGRLGKPTHERTVKAATEWILQEPQIALPYLARGFSRLRLGQYARAIEDFDRAGQCDPRLAALCRAACAYALARQGEHRKSGIEFGKALKLDPKLATIHIFRGHAYIEQEQYTKAEKEFRWALQIGKDAPEAHEAIALLLAASPHESVRDGKKAVEHATKACELVKWANWAYLGTLAAAYAEAGQYDRAVEWAAKAIELAPAESRADLQQRLGLYQASKPYRLK